MATLNELYDDWARLEAAQLKNRTIEEFKQKFRPVRLETNGTRNWMIVQDTETLEEHEVEIVEDWAN